MMSKLLQNKYSYYTLIPFGLPFIFININQYQQPIMFQCWTGVSSQERVFKGCQNLTQGLRTVPYCLRAVGYDMYHYYL